MKKSILVFLGILLLLVSFSFAYAPAQAQVVLEEPAWQGLVPCGRNSGVNGETEQCNLCHLIIGIKRIVQYGLYLVTTIAFIGIFIAGVMYIISSGDEAMITQAKSFLKASLIGFTVVISAWLIINVTFWVIAAKNDLGIQKSSWYEFNCSVTSSQE
ncbi:MAG: hypothetical protein COU40_02880 [Candidatus Moranbacteria bacterium CG10_big_fil_rev_8_21_14_0_10_35_21]|nr:MAG: hypothetical protein COU40_02880 [Candidatus Moranbacteria bacterium CG10_big_fil_rev_8_21_14_0_10_35_21]PJA88480.1 MAG: hypothetical protein CO139_02915 [Candidatus Moranbacteria bacterium CG_4_9_14_3_um_filter_36_9]